MSDTRLDMLKRAEMRWMSAEDATITVSARAVAELGRDWKAAEAERDELLRSSSLASYEGMERRAEIAEAEAKRLRGALRTIEHWPYTVMGERWQIDVSQIKEFARAALDGEQP